MIEDMGRSKSSMTAKIHFRGRSEPAYFALIIVPHIEGGIRKIGFSRNVCITWSSGHASKGQTTAGLPEKISWQKAST